MLSPDSVRYLLVEEAEIFKDWGSSGFDNTYGRGGVFLHTFHPDTVWVDRRVGNTAAEPSEPYYYVDDAQSAAPEGGRILFLGDAYPEIITLSKPLRYESIGSDAVVGP